MNTHMSWIEERPESAMTEPPGMTLWERVAETRWGAYTTRVEADLVHRALRLAGPPSEAIDLGCEGGRWSKQLADQGWSMTCVDVNPRSLDACRHKVPNARHILASPNDTTIPFQTNGAGLLMCIEVAPVIDSDWFLPEANRVLEPGGVLVGVCWNRLSWRGVAHNLKKVLTRDVKGDFYRRTFSSWKAELLRHQFSLIDAVGFCWGPFGRESNSPLVPFFTGCERLLQLHRFTSLSPWVGFIARKNTGG